jgi:hypothetical protein
MSTTYTGVPANVTASAAPTTTIPQDAVDSLNAASLNVALQKLTDYIAQIETQAGFTIITFGGIAGNTVTTYACWQGGYRVDAMNTGVPNSIGNVIQVPFGYRIAGIAVHFANLMVGGSMTAQGYDATGGGVIGPSVTVNAGSRAGNSTASPASMAANRLIGMQITNNAGVTTGPGQFIGHLYLTLA